MQHGLELRFHAWRVAAWRCANAYSQIEVPERDRPRWLTRRTAIKLLVGESHRRLRIPCIALQARKELAVSDSEMTWIDESIFHMEPITRY
jgi:hypothetical protein